MLQQQKHRKVQLLTLSLANRMSSYLPEFFSKINISEGDVIFLASDINQLARNLKSESINFDVQHFIDSIQEKLGNGTLVIPAYTDNLKSGDQFIWETSKPTTGAISNRVFKRKDFIRTTDPLHSVFVWGKHQKEILELDDESTFGHDSIFGFLDRNNAKMIIIDVDLQNSYTFVHYIEEKLKVNYRKPYTWQMNLLKDNVIEPRKVIFHTKRPGVRTELTNLQNWLIDKAFMKEHKIYGVRVFEMDLHESGKGIEQFIRQGGKMYTFKLIDWAKDTAKLVLRK